MFFEQMILDAVGCFWFIQTTFSALYQNYDCLFFLVVFQTVAFGAE